MNELESRKHFGSHPVFLRCGGWGLVQNKVVQNEAFSTHSGCSLPTYYMHNSLLYVQFSPEIATFVVEFHTFDHKMTTFEQQEEHVALDWTCNMHTLILGFP